MIGSGAADPDDDDSLDRRIADLLKQIQGLEERSKRRRAEEGKKEGLTLEELLKNLQTSMDSSFHQVFERLDAHDAHFAAIEANMATKKDVAELRHAVVAGTKSITDLMNGITGQTLSLEDRLEELRRRIDALEKRLPPEAA